MPAYSKNDSYSGSSNGENPDIRLVFYRVSGDTSDIWWGVNWLGVAMLLLLEEQRLGNTFYP